MSTASVIAETTNQFISDSKSLSSKHDAINLLSPLRVLEWLLTLLYIFVQRVIIFFFKPYPPKAPDLPKKPFGRIAVVGAGLTGISSAAHAIAHGFDVVIYESNDSVGGIWAHVNKTSGLQLNSMLYRFHPAVLWSRGFPLRDEILGEIRRIWKEYQLKPRTRFNTPVTSVRRASSNDDDDTDPSKLGHARWIVNDGSDGIFDAVIVTVGTCGKPKMVQFKGMPESKSSAQDDHHDADGDSAHPDYDEPNGTHERHHGSSSSSENEDKEKDENLFLGPIIHSSQMDSLPSSQLEGKTVVVIGSGASGVEAIETALEKGAGRGVIIAREDKWIIPRNMVVDTLIASQPFGREMPLSFLWETFLKHWHYHGVEDLVPPHTGLFESTPIVNDAILPHIRHGACTYIRGDTLRLTSRGVLVNARPRLSKPGEEGEEREVEADVVVMATGFEKPKVDFLPADGEGGLFPDGYERPDLYLQNFATEDWSVLMTNSSYMNAIGTVGHFHIGIYTRILLVLLLDKNARPTPRDMKLWVDVVRFLKRGARGGALGFFTYMELTIWLLLFHLFRPDRIRWLFFIMQGWGVYPEE